MDHEDTSEEIEPHDQTHRKPPRSSKRLDPSQGTKNKFESITTQPRSNESHSLATPSLAKRNQAWKNKQPRDFTVHDLLGYWLCRHVELLGHEDPAFLRNFDSRNFQIIFRNMKLCLRNFFDNDTCKFVHAIDVILTTAPADKRAFNYFFTPSNFCTLNRLLTLKPGETFDRKPGFRRMKTIVSADNISGSNGQKFDDSMNQMLGELDDLR